MRMTAKSVLNSFRVAILLFGIVATSAHAAEVTRYRSSGPGASAGFGGSDGCVSSDVYVASDGTNVFVNAWQYDWCTAVLLKSIYGSVPIDPTGQFTGTRRLDYADLMADIVAHDSVTDTDVPLHIDLSWEGEGDVFKGMSQNQSRSGAYFFSQRGSGSFRYATPSGTISDGVTNYVVGTAYAWGQLSYTTNSSLTVVH